MFARVSPDVARRRFLTITLPLVLLFAVVAPPFGILVLAIGVYRWGVHLEETTGQQMVNVLLAVVPLLFWISIIRLWKKGNKMSFDQAIGKNVATCRDA
jgi:hypothetical protein